MPELTPIELPRPTLDPPDEPTPASESQETAQPPQVRTRIRAGALGYMDSAGIGELIRSYS